MFSDLMHLLRALFRGAETGGEPGQDLPGQLEHRAQKAVRSGLADEESLRRAHLGSGELEQVRGECRGTRGVGFIQATIQDVRYGARMLGKNPVFSLVAVTTLALGIGANTAVFSLLESVVLRFLPVEKPEELVQIMRRSPRGANQPISSFTNPI